MTRQIVVTTLCGCPASGKSTAAAQMIKELAPIASTYYISFDVIERALTKTNTWNREVWKESRTKAYQLLSSLLYDLKNNVSLPMANDYLQVESSTSSNLHIIVLDDTMHLRSMRRSVMRMCQFYEVGYCTLYFHCSLEKCLLRNSLRENKVPDSTIKTIFTTMEPPDSSIYWERNFISISTEEATLLSSSVYLVITDASLHPVQKIKNEKEENTASYTSFKHKVELELRRAVSRVAQLLDSSQKQKMKQVNDLKKRMQSVSSSFSGIIDETNIESIINNIIEQFTTQCSYLIKNPLY